MSSDPLYIYKRGEGWLATRHNYDGDLVCMYVDCEGKVYRVETRDIPNEGEPWTALMIGETFEEALNWHTQNCLPIASIGTWCKSNSKLYDKYLVFIPVDQ